MDQKIHIIGITQEMILPNAIKPRHQVGLTQKGDIFYNQDGKNFGNLTIGTSYQFLVVVKGIPSWITFPQTGVAANRPTSGRFNGDEYLATDTFAFSVWTGAAWKSTTLS